MIDERLLAHRWRATSHAAVVGALLTGGLLLYEHIGRGVLRWDLASILGAMALTKITAMIYYRLRD